MFAFTHPLKNIFPQRGRIRVQRYENILNYANKNAKNVRNICEKVQNLKEGAIKDGSLPLFAAGRRYAKTPDYAVGSLCV